MLTRDKNGFLALYFNVLFLIDVLCILQAD